MGKTRTGPEGKEINQKHHILVLQIIFPSAYLVKASRAAANASQGAPNRTATGLTEADMFPRETCMFQARCMFRDNQQISNRLRGLTGHMSLLSSLLPSPHVPLPTLILSPAESCPHTCHHHSGGTGTPNCGQESGYSNTGC